MAWLKFDDGVPMHPKHLKAGHVAAWLWFAGVCYCRRHLTDGIIPREALAGLAPTIKKPLAEAARLVSVGLWHEVPDGWQVHDFHDWNPTRSDVESERKVDRERKRNPTGILQEPSCVGAGDVNSPSKSSSDSGHSGLERARENLSTLHGRRNLDLMTYGPVKLWASQFRDEIVPLVATHFGGDRDVADGPARAWIGDVDEANQTTVPSAAALKAPAKWWTEQAIARWVNAPSHDIGRCSGCGSPDGQCADVKVCNTRWLEQQKAAQERAQVSA